METRGHGEEKGPLKGVRGMKARPASRCSQGAFHRRRRHSATYTVYPQHEYQWGPPKIQPFFPAHAAATRPDYQPASAARARPCSATDLSCLECEKSACWPLPATQLSHKPTSVPCVCVRVCILKHAASFVLFLPCLPPRLSVCSRCTRTVNPCMPLSLYSSIESTALTEVM